MIQALINEKGFKVIGMSEWDFGCKLNRKPICASCLRNPNPPNKWYYVATLNAFYCQGCYDRWWKQEVKPCADKEKEADNFERMKQFLDLKY